MKKFLKILVALAVIAAILVTAAIIWSKDLLAFSIGEMLGGRVTIESISLDGKNHILYMKKLKVYNPGGFDESKVLAYLPEVDTAYNPGALLAHRKIHITALKIYMKTMTVTQNKDGKLNINNLRIANKTLDVLPVKIDRMTLTVDEVVYEDYTKGPKPHVEVYQVNIKAKDYEDMPSVEQVAMRIVTEALAQTAIKGAALYGVAALAGASLAGPLLLPAGAAIIFSGKDSYEADFNVSYASAFETALKTAREMGKNISQHKETGIIGGAIDGASVRIKLVKTEKNKTHITVSARKFFFPKPRIAGGVLYEISQNVKK